MSFSECLGLSGILIWERGREGIPGERGSLSEPLACSRRLRKYLWGVRGRGKKPEP